MARGHSLKLIAHELNISLSTVSTHVAHLATRLKTTSRADLMARLAGLLAPAPSMSLWDARAAGLRLSNAPDPAEPPVLTSLDFLHSFNDQEWVLLSYPLIPFALWEPLTPAERTVATKLLRGHSGEVIASARHSSLGTVLNHTAAIFRKMKVNSRQELIALALHGGIVDAAVPVDAVTIPERRCGRGVALRHVGEAELHL